MIGTMSSRRVSESLSFVIFFFLFFFFNDTATTEIYTLSLHDALPIYFGFYGNARKIDGKEIPYYQMLLGGGYDEQGMMRFGLAVQSIPARLAPAAVTRVVLHFIANRLEGESFRQYVMRHRVETFRELTNEFAKPAELFPEIYQDWGDEEAYSLQLCRGERAA